VSTVKKDLVIIAKDLFLLFREIIFLHFFSIWMFSSTTIVLGNNHDVALDYNPQK